MKKKLNNKGSISVFLLLVFTSLLFLAGVLVDAARIMTAERNIERALYTAARSVMAGCEPTMAGEFGLYGMSCAESQAEFTKYFTINLIERHKNLAFIAYDIKNIAISGANNSSLLSSTEYEQQILQYMKYKGPLLITENIVEKFKKSQVGGRIEIAEKSSDLAKRYGELTDEVKKVNFTMQDIQELYQRDPEKSLSDLKELQESLKIIRAIDINYQENIEDINTKLKDLTQENGENYTKLSTLAEHDDIMENIDLLERKISNNISVLRKAILLKKDKSQQESPPDILQDWEALPQITIAPPESPRYLSTKDIQAKENLLQKLRCLCDKELEDSWLIEKGDFFENDLNLSLQNTEQSIAEQTVNLCNNIKSLKNMLKKLEIIGRNRVLISEYVLDKYTFATSRTERNHYFQKGEIEYIICGNKKEVANILQVFTKIWSLRFAINSVDRMITSKITQPLLRFADALVEGFIQACADMHSLYKGEGVSLCPSLEKNLGIALKYSDHLRFFLLLQDKEIQLARMRQLVQINVKMTNPDFAINNITTHFQGSAEVMVNLWFLPLFHLDKIGIKNFTGDKYLIKREIILEY